MKYQTTKLLVALVLLVPAAVVQATTRSSFCNNAPATVMRSKGCGGTCKRFCALSACCAAINGSLLVNGTLHVNGIDLSSSNALASTVLGTGLVEPKIGYAEFIGTSTNNTAGTSADDIFRFETEVVNSSAGAVVSSVTSNGTAFSLAQGTYIIDFEAVLGANQNFRLFSGATIASLVATPYAVSGNGATNTNTGFTHCRTTLEVPAGGLVVAVSSSSGLSQVIATIFPLPIIRITFLKIA